MSSTSDPLPVVTGAAHAPGDSVTLLLQELAAGGSEAAHRLAPVVYEELHVLAVAAMRGEAEGHTLRPTELVHAAFSRLVDHAPIPWQSRRQFYSVAARAMRRLLVDHARARRMQKRDGGERVALTVDVASVEPDNVDVIDLNGALEKLAHLDPRQVQVVELRYFAGFSIEEIADILAVSPATVKRDWTVARAFLRGALAEYADERREA